MTYVGKYTGSKTLIAARLKRLAMERSLRSLVSWVPLTDPEPGYTVIIGGVWRLRELAAANLRFIAQQDAPRMREVILAFDASDEEATPEEVAKLTAHAGDVPVRVLTCTPGQLRVARFWEWGWVYAWMNWARGIAESRTSHVLLHDLDAIPLERSFFERRYDMAVESECDFYGVSWYEGNGVETRDRITRTYEMVMNAAAVRASFKPIDGFNKVARFNARTFDFDTFCYMQFVHRRSGYADTAEGDLVHPSQMITNVVDLMTGRLRGIDPTKTNLPLMPVYLIAGGDPEAARSIIAKNGSAQGRSIELLGKTLDLSKYRRGHWEWVRGQAEQLADRLPGDDKDLAHEYLDYVERVVPE